MSMLDAALRYSAMGWPVFPCKEKVPITTNGFKDATTNDALIHTWWGNEDHNVAIRTGVESGLVVVDIDAKHNGLISYDMFKDDLPPTYTVRTGGGGLHLYFQYPLGEDIRNKTSLFEGVDIRAEGGYVIAPPSMHESGAPYEVMHDVALAEMPHSFLLLLKQAKHNSVPAGIRTSDGSVAEGGRNDYLARMAGSMRRKGFCEEAIEEALLQQNSSVCAPPLGEGEVRRIAKNISRYIATAPVVGEIVAEKVAERVAELVPAMWKEIIDGMKMTGEPTGITGLDDLLGGGKRLGEVTVLHAEAKTGKNALWHKMMYMWLEKGIPLAYASREISPMSEVTPALLGLHFKMDLFSLWKQEPIPEHLRAEFLNKANEWPLYFSQGYGYFPIEQMEEWVDYCYLQGVRYFWFDHLHYLISDPEDFKQASLFMKQLKTMAKEKNVHVDIIVQPNKLGKEGKIGIESVKGGSGIVQAIDNFLVFERIDEKKHVSRLKLERARHRRSKKGEILLQYDTVTGDFLEVVAEKKTLSPLPNFLSDKKLEEW